MIKFVKAEVSPLFCDKLSITMAIPTKDEAVVVTSLAALSGAGYAIGSPKGGYSASFQIDVSGDQSQVPSFLLVQHGPKMPKAAFLRFEFNPAKSDLHHVREFMNAIVPGGYSSLVQKGVCTRIDATLDVRNVDINRLLIRHPVVRVSETYCRKDRLETYYLGARTSERRFCVYDKAAEIKRKNADSIFKLPVPKGRITRIEARVKKNWPLQKLAKLENPFLQLHVSKPHLAAQDGEKFGLFLEAVRFQGAQKILSGLSEKTRQEYQAKLDVQTPAWWNPPELWKQWLPLAGGILDPPSGPYSLTAP